MPHQQGHLNLLNTPTETEDNTKEQIVNVEGKIMDKQGEVEKRKSIRVIENCQ